jgi:hypothetical protein
MLGDNRLKGIIFSVPGMISGCGRKPTEGQLSAASALFVVSEARKIAGILLQICV